MTASVSSAACERLTLDGPLEEAGAGLGGGARGAERVAAGDVLQHDPAASLGVALRRGAPSAISTRSRSSRGGLGELLHGEGRRGDDEQRLERVCELVERIGGDQAERTVHARLLSASRAGDANRCERPCLSRARSRSCGAARGGRGRRPPARRARARPPPGRSRSGCAATRSARKRSTNWESGGNFSAMWRSDTVGRLGGEQRAARRRAAPDPAARAAARAAVRAAPARGGRSGRPPLRGARRASRRPPSYAGTRRGAAPAPRPPPPARAPRARPPPRRRGRAPSARAAPR